MDSTCVPRSMGPRAVQYAVPHRYSRIRTCSLRTLLSWCQEGSTAACCTAYNSMHHLDTFIQVLRWPPGAKGTTMATLRQRYKRSLNP